MKILDILEAFDAVQRFNKCRIPMKHSIKVRRALGVLAPEWTIVNEKRDVLFDRYGKKDGDGKLVQRQEAGGLVTELDDPEAFSAEWSELMEQPTDVSIAGIAIADLGDDLPITGEDIELLVRIGVLIEASPNGKPKRRRAKRK